MYEVTAALEDAVMPQPSFSIPPAPSARPASHGFDAVADEEISLRDLESQETANNRMETPKASLRAAKAEPVQKDLSGDTMALKEAFAAVNEVMEKNGHKPIAPLRESQAAQMVAEPKAEEFRPLSSVEFVEDLGSERDEQSHQFFKVLYKVLLDNEVDEIYINQFPQHQRAGLSDFQCLPEDDLKVGTAGSDLADQEQAQGRIFYRTDRCRQDNDHC